MLLNSFLAELYALFAFLEMLLIPFLADLYAPELLTSLVSFSPALVSLYSALDLTEFALLRTSAAVGILFLADLYALFTFLGILLISFLADLYAFLADLYAPELLTSLVSFSPALVSLYSALDLTEFALLRTSAAVGILFLADLYALFTFLGILLISFLADLYAFLADLYAPELLTSLVSFSPALVSLYSAFDLTEFAFALAAFAVGDLEALSRRYFPNVAFATTSLVTTFLTNFAAFLAFFLTSSG